jgi:hypothetical protein
LNSEEGVGKEREMRMEKIGSTGLIGQIGQVLGFSKPIRSAAARCALT